jgi:hypothetical protein
MPAWGLVPDSPLIYYGKKGLRTRRRGKPIRRGGGFGVRPIIQTKTKTSWRIFKVVIDDNALHKFLNTPLTDEHKPAPLWMALHAKGNIAVAGAKKKVGVKTGALRKSITMRHLGNRTGQYLWIGSKLPYAYLHHQGTRPHPIVAKNPGGALVFTKGARIVRTPMVKHPGTRPNWYLRAQLRHFKTLV